MKTTTLTEAVANRTTFPRLFSAAAALGLLAAPLRAQVPQFEVYTTNQTVPATFTATLAAFHTLSNGVGFAWYFDNHDQPIPGATNYLLNIPHAQSTNAGTYVLVMSNAFGSVTSSPPMTLTVTNISFQAPSLQFSTLASFSEYVDGGFPQSGVMQASDGCLYGTTLKGGPNAGSTNGTVFKMSTNGNFIWSFAFNYTNGQAPAAGLVQTGDGNLYGATIGGGSNGFGTVFRITTNGVFTSLYSFGLGLSTAGGYPQAALCVGVDGYLYGTTSTNDAGDLGGAIFKMSTNGGAPVWSYPLTGGDGNVPLAGLMQALDGSFYGTASQGGAGNVGTIFRISSNEVFSNLYSFTGGADGAYPAGGLVQGPDGQLYGTTSGGGNANVNSGQGYGGIFKITTNGAFTLVLDFDGTNGGSPQAALTLAGDGNFYGTANAGGVGYLYSLNNLFPPVYGTVFQLATNGALTTIFSFDGNDSGNAPHSTLWQGRDGGLYGTTSQGGANDLALSLLSFGDGTVFRLGVLPPAIQSAAANSDTFSFSWNAMPGVPYQAQYKDALDQSPWLNLGGSVLGANGVASQSDNIGPTNTARFYRVSLKF